jgi:hypothetical protein
VDVVSIGFRKRFVRTAQCVTSSPGFRPPSHMKCRLYRQRLNATFVRSPTRDCPNACSLLLHPSCFWPCTCRSAAGGLEHRPGTGKQRHRVSSDHLKVYRPLEVTLTRVELRERLSMKVSDILFLPLLQCSCTSAESRVLSLSQELRASCRGTRELEVGGLFVPRPLTSVVEL